MFGVFGAGADAKDMIKIAAMKAAKEKARI